MCIRVMFYSQYVCHATFGHPYITFDISSILNVKRFIILHVIRFIWLHWSIWICRLFCIIQDMYVCHSRCKVTTKNPKNNGFQILWQHVADSCSGCLGCICSKGAFLAVILHPKGKAMDGASISFREEQGLMFRKGLDFPNSFHSGRGRLLTKANSNPP